MKVKVAYPHLYHSKSKHFVNKTKCKHCLAFGLSERLEFFDQLALFIAQIFGRVDL